MHSPPLWTLNSPASRATVAVLLLLSAATVLRPATTGEDSPVVAGTQLHALVLPVELGKVLPGRSVSSPVVVEAVRGRWVLVEYQGNTGKPVWLNLDQVISFRTER